MSRIDEILFASLQLPIVDWSHVTTSLLEIADEHWHWDEYRGTRMLPFMTHAGGKDRLSIQNRAQAESFDLTWTEFASPEVIEYFDRHVFPWMGMRTRIMVLRTPPGECLHEHIDCSPSAYGSLQHKFRIVLQGRTDTLYFVTRDSRVHAPQTFAPFIIDGSWPHGMLNDSIEEKITICAGAPWTGSSQYPLFETVVSKKGLLPPEDLAQYFDAKYSR